MKKKYSNEIQIEIDDVYGCPGHCPGCVLSNLERRSIAPDMNLSILEKSIQKLIDYIPTLDNLDKINLTYGIADHLIMDNDYLEKIFRLGAKLIKSANLSNPYNGVFITSSMIGKHEHVMSKIKHIHNISKEVGVPFYIIAVLDPKNLYHKKFADIYKTNIIETNKLLGKVDLSINLSQEAIEMISPKELFEFAKINNFDEVTINWTPTFDNLQFVYNNQKQLSTWLIEFDKQIQTHPEMGTSYRPVILRTINSLKCEEPENTFSFQENLFSNMPELVKKSIQIDEKGNIFPKYEAIGDIAHTPRLGFEPIGNVQDNINISEMFENKYNQIRKTITKQFSLEPCTSCKHNLYCSNSGFHIYSYIIKAASKNNLNYKSIMDSQIKSEGCPHIAKTMFDYYEAEASKLDATCSNKP